MGAVVVVIGEALIDLVIQPDGSVTSALGGAPFNTARAIGRLGRSVEFVGALSDDRFGTLLTEQLERDGVGTRYAPRTSRPSTLAAAELDRAGGAQYRFYIDGTSAPLLTPPDLELLPLDPPVLFTGGLGLVLEPMAETVAGFVARVAPATTVFVDVNCRPRVILDREAYLARLGRVFDRADIVKVSDEDIEYLFPGAGPPAAADQLLARGPAAVVVTGGSTSTLVATAEGSRVVPVAPLTAPVVDTIGAGDTFGAGLLAAWIGRGGRRSALGDAGALDDLEQAVIAAHAAAAVVVTRRGADPPRRDELPETWAS